LPIQDIDMLIDRKGLEIRNREKDGNIMASST